MICFILRSFTDFQNSISRIHDIAFRKVTQIWISFFELSFLFLFLFQILIDNNTVILISSVVSLCSTSSSENEEVHFRLRSGKSWLRDGMDRISMCTNDFPYRAVFSRYWCRHTYWRCYDLKYCCYWSLKIDVLCGNVINRTVGTPCNNKETTFATLLTRKTTTHLECEWELNSGRLNIFQLLRVLTRVVDFFQLLYLALQSIDLILNRSKFKYIRNFVLRFSYSSSDANSRQPSLRIWNDPLIASSEKVFLMNFFSTS